MVVLAAAGGGAGDFPAGLGEEGLAGSSAWATGLKKADKLPSLCTSLASGGGPSEAELG